MKINKNPNKPTLNPPSHLAFTLAEVMIVLAIIGVLSAILLPVAHNSIPNEDILKFKKTYNVFTNAVHELVVSDKYYFDGDLGRMPNGDLVSSSSYFCKTLADVVSYKDISCNDDISPSVHSGGWIDKGENNVSFYSAEIDDWYCFKECLESTCVTNKVVLNNGAEIYDAAPFAHFGVLWDSSQGKYNEGVRLFGGGYLDSGGFDRLYKIFCIDIDGTKGDEYAFGIGVRADGKIFPGRHAQVWIAKSVQEKN